MRFFFPDVRLPIELLGPRGPEDHFGGLPWGLPQHLWPRCVCGNPMSFLAQFTHDESRCPLGREGRNLFIFRCADYPEDKAACVVVDAENLLDGPTKAPEGAILDEEVRVLRWIAENDGLTIEDAFALRSPQRQESVDAAKFESLYRGTRLAGVPAWFDRSQAPTLDASWYFLGQVNTEASFFATPRRPPSWVQPAQADGYGRLYVGRGARGAQGMAYIFGREVDGRFEARVVWQRAYASEPVKCAA